MNNTYISYTICLVVLLFLLDFYCWKRLRISQNKRFYHYLKWLIPITSILFIACIFSKIFTIKEGNFNASLFSNFAFGLAIGCLFTKITMALLFLFGDMIELFYFIKRKISSTPKDNAVAESRRNFVRNISLGVAAVPFLGTIYAITKGKYNFHTKRLDVFFERLPSSFNGLKVVQFSDFHAGSFDDIHAVQKGLERINEAQPDVIVFTGDLVNNRTVEAYPYKELFAKMHAKYGKYAILGNHDYGDYIPFSSTAERNENLAKMEQFYKACGFTLLRNENVQISNGEDIIDLIGVENWGIGHFPKYGDIQSASKGLPSDRFRILLSHDPDHWEYQVRELPEFYDFTLSGHTHGAQMGVSIPGWKWSPIKYRYKRWLGLYEIDKRKLFVSKGFGFLGFPGRIGMPPEIVSFRLYRKEV